MQAALPYLTISGCRSSAPIPLLVTNCLRTAAVLLAVESLSVWARGLPLPRCDPQPGGGGSGTPGRPDRARPRTLELHPAATRSPATSGTGSNSSPSRERVGKSLPRQGQAARGMASAPTGTFAPQPCATAATATHSLAWALPDGGGLTLHCRRRGPTVERRSCAWPGALLRGFRYLSSGPRGWGGNAPPRFGIRAI